MKHFTMPPTLTEHENLSRTCGCLFNQIHEHAISLAILYDHRDHIRKRQLSKTSTRWWILIVFTFIFYGKYIHLILILSFDGKKSRTHKPMKYFRESILSFGCCGETEYVLRTQFK